MIKGEAHVVGKVMQVKTKKRLEYIPGEMVLRVKEGAVRPHLSAARLQFTAAHAKTLPETVRGPVEYLHKNAGLKHIRPIFSLRQTQLQRASVRAAERSWLAVLSSVADSSSEDLSGIIMVKVDPREVTPTLMKHLKSSKAVALVEPMPARWLQVDGTADPTENLQWGLRAIKWFSANRPSAAEIRVGVMDTGVDTTHPDLKDVIETFHHDGLLDRDLIGHGTHVCGIIAATVNNDVGIAGVANCRIVVWKIFNDRPGPDGEFYVDGERYLRALGDAREANLRAVNLSIGGTASSQTEQLLFRRLEQGGVAVAAAMGNEYHKGNPTEYPAAYQTVMAVGAVAENLRRSSFSNTGQHIAVVAPGSNILSTLPLKGSDYLTETEYASWSGTSMATPHVAGAAALLAAKNAGWGPAEIKKHLMDTAAKLAPMGKKNWTSTYGAGLLNLKAALG